MFHKIQIDSVTTYKDCIVIRFETGYTKHISNIIYVRGEIKTLVLYPITRLEVLIKDVFISHKFL